MNLLLWRWWQWMLLGLAAAALITWVRLPLDLEPGVYRLSQFQFERGLVAREPSGNIPSISTVVVFPRQRMIDASDPAQKATVPMDMVTGTMESAFNGVRRTTTYRYIATVPYRSRGLARLGDTSQQTVIDVAQRAQRRRNDLSVRYAWWLEPKWVTTLWGGGTFALLGVAAPLIVRVLTRGQRAALRAAKAQQREADRAAEARRQAEEAERQRRGAAASTRAQRVRAEADAQLQDLNDRLEAAVAPMLDAAEQPAEGDGSPASGAPAVRRLDAGPLTIDTSANKPAASQSYTGEFYPVARGPAPSDKEEPRT